MVRYLGLGMNQGVRGASANKPDVRQRFFDEVQERELTEVGLYISGLGQGGPGDRVYTDQNQMGPRGMRNGYRVGDILIQEELRLVYRRKRDRKDYRPKGKIELAKILGVNLVSVSRSRKKGVGFVWTGIPIANLEELAEE